jgi:hypothetical protein
MSMRPYVATALMASPNLIAFSGIAYTVKAAFPPLFCT